MSKKVGFIGLGLMGGNMSLHLMDNGYDVIGYDVYPGVVEKFKDYPTQFTMAGSIAEVVKGVDFVCTSLPTVQSILDAYLEPEGILQNAKSGTICIDLSSVDPQTTRTIHDKGLEYGVSVIDCPVSGDPTNARAGSLVLIIGGDDEPIEKSQELFECLGKTMHRAGPSGSGEIVKLVNNVISMSCMLLSCEAFMLGVKAGIEPATLYNILCTSGARNYQLNKRIPRVLDGNFDPLFKMETAFKDLDLAMAMSRQVGMPTFMFGESYEIFRAGLAKGLAEEDCVAIIKFYEDMLGVEARKKEGDVVNIKLV